MREKLMRMRDFFPKSFWLRSVLIVFLPVVLVQLFSGYIFFNRHWEPVTRYLSQGLAHRVITGYTWVEQDDTFIENPQIVPERLNSLLGLNVVFVPAPPTFDEMRFHPFQSRFERALRSLISRPYKLRMRARLTYVWVKSNRGWLEFRFPTKWLLSRSSLWWGVWSLGSAILFCLLALFFLYRQLLPLRNLVQFAKKIETGRLLELPPLRGALEIRQIGSTLQYVYEKLWTHSEDMKVMLIGLSQDLKNLLSRMKLQLSLMPGEQADKKLLSDDLLQMDHMITSYIGFAETGQLGKPSKVSVLNLLMSLLKEIDKDKRSAIQVSVPKKFFISVDVLSLKRTLAHLIKNACQHARKGILVSIKEESGFCHVRVADDGSGVLPRDQARIFKPFVRLDTDKNVTKVSAGIGLAVAHNFARLSGGHIEASKDPDLGGLQVNLTFPVSQPV